MAGALARLGGHRDPASRAVAAALRATALGRVSPPERAWIDRIEAWRRELPREALEFDPSGSGDPGSADDQPDERLAATAGMCGLLSVSPVWGRFLMHLIRHLAPRSCLELGTGLGMSAAYQAAALELNAAGHLITIDTGEWARIAERAFSELGLERRVEVLVARPEDALGLALERSAPLDYAFLDADHTEQGTLEQFDVIVPRLSSEAVVVVDDINWTSAMRRAWKSIRRHEGVALAVGLRRVGVAVVRAASAAP